MGSENPEISIIMGSQSDWSVMAEASAILQELVIAHETKIISAHRTPDRMSEFAKSAASNGIKVIIAGAGGAAQLSRTGVFIARHVLRHGIRSSILLVLLTQ